MTKDNRVNIKLSKEGLKKMKGLKKPGESYNQMANRLYCKSNPKDTKCKRRNDGWNKRGQGW